MSEFIETTEEIRPIGGTSMIYVGEEAKLLGLRQGEKVVAVLCRPESRDHVMSLLYGSDPYLFFISVGSDNSHPFYDIRKSLSERTLAQSLDYRPIMILGPFGTLPECRRFRDILQQKQETDPSVLKDLFGRFTK